MATRPAVPSLFLANNGRAASRFSKRFGSSHGTRPVVKTEHRTQSTIAVQQMDVTVVHETTCAVGNGYYAERAQQ